MFHYCKLPDGSRAYKLAFLEEESDIELVKHYIKNKTDGEIEERQGVIFGDS